MVNDEWLASGFFLEFGMLRTGAVEGTVRTASGVGVADAQLTLLRHTPTLDFALFESLGIRLPTGLLLGEFIPWASTQSGGRYRIDRVFPVRDDSSIMLLVDGLRSTQPMPKLSSLGESKELNWVIPDAYGSIVGCLTFQGKPSSEAEIAWESAVYGTADRMKCKEDGSFHFDVVAPGSIELFYRRVETDSPEHSKYTVAPGSCLDIAIDVAGGAH